MTPPFHPAVRAAFYAFSVRFEGAINHLYPDKDGGITTSVGYLCDSPTAARTLPLRHPDGRLATGDEIEAEWHAVKANTAAAANGAGWLKRTGGVHLFLSDDDVRGLCMARYDVMATDLGRRVPGCADWPAPAQLALVSMAWALGVDGLLEGFPKCCAACRRQNFLAAAAECTIDDRTNPGLTARNRANRLLFEAAAHVVATGGDRTELLMAPPATTPPGSPAPGSPAPDLTTTRGVQLALVQLGHDPGPVDGKPGPKTTTAVKAFQAARGLTTDGVVGPKTRAALGEALAG